MSKQVIKTPTSTKYARKAVSDFMEDPQSVQLDFKSRSKPSKLNRKAWSDLRADLSGNLSDAYSFQVKQRDAAALSGYNKNLADMLINGNLRIKFIPKCSTRAGARLYCESKLDDKGYPRYKLIGTNATDPFGNKICDMNGDQVDDIIICNSQGTPVIVNGYKLVPASPYKKIWKNMKAAGATDDSFESWLASQFNAVKDWSNITADEWQNGKTSWTVASITDENARAAYNTYNELGLGKPRISTRLSASAVWSSLYAKFAWQDVITSFCDNAPGLRSIFKVIDYLKVANAMYIKFVELPVATQLGQGGNWVSWTNYKQVNKEQVRKALGLRVQEIYKAVVASSASDTSKTAAYNDKNNTLYQIVKASLDMLEECLGNIVGSTEEVQQLALGIEQGTVDKQDLKAYKDDFKKIVVQYITDFAPNYAQLVIQKNKAKVKPVHDIGNYALMRWKTGDNDDGFDFDSDGDNTQL